MKIDDWFKPLLLVFIVAFLFISYWHSQNGRYIFIHSDGNIITGDSRTGTAYAISSGNALKFELPSGKMTTSPMKKNEVNK